MNAQTQDPKLEQILGYARDNAGKGMVNSALGKLNEAREYASKVGLDITDKIQAVEKTLGKKTFLPREKHQENFCYYT